MWSPDKEELEKLRGPLDFMGKYVYAGEASRKLRASLSQAPIFALGCLDGLQALQCVKSGRKSIYVSGWQTAAVNNDADEMYPDLGLYPSNSVPKVIRKINNTLRRAAQVDKLQNKSDVDYLCPIVADLENGFGGPLKTFELVKSAIEEGVAGIHLEDQAVHYERKCGHLGGKIVVHPNDMIDKLKAARTAAEFCGVDTVIIARTDAMTAKYSTSPFGQYVPPNCLYQFDGDLTQVIYRCYLYAPYADVLWVETPTPSLEEAKKIAYHIHKHIPNKWLAYNLSPSFNWNDSGINLVKYQEKLFGFGYRYVFITLAGFHTSAYSMFNLSKNCQKHGMATYARLQRKEKDLLRYGYTSLKHQTEAGTEWFDKLQEVITGNKGTSMEGSTERSQFN